MILGAVYEREMKVAPRSRGLFVARAVYCGALLGIVATCWLVVTGSQTVATVVEVATLFFARQKGSIHWSSFATNQNLAPKMVNQDPKEISEAKRGSR